MSSFTRSFAIIFEILISFLVNLINFGFAPLLILLKIDPAGSILSNMSKGAKPKLIKLTKKEIKISNIIAKDLVKEDIYFAGIDFIDEKLNGDINVTSPTGLKTFFDLSNINLADYFWKGLRA